MSPAIKLRNSTWALSAMAGLASFSHARPAIAEEFALSASPPRFELVAKPGETVRSVVELENASMLAANFDVGTAEWTLTPAGGIVLSNALVANSCRPWVAIERRKVSLPAKSKFRYRFEVSPPADTAPTECRFAIVLSGAEERIAPTEQTSFPVSAQIALIVYVAVGEVKPEIAIVKADVVSINGAPTPVLMVQNTGTAHGRLTAHLSGTDSKQKRREFSAATLPILPGETRMISLSVDDGVDAVAVLDPDEPDRKELPQPIAFPLTVSGTISDSVKSFKFEGTFAP